MAKHVIQEKFRQDPDLKYKIYELAVQDPRADATNICKIFREIKHHEPHSLREDFCGTFYFSTEWVKRDSKNTALAMDLDRSPLDFGERTHLRRLKPSQQKRMSILQQNVLTDSKPVDLSLALNFSYWCFKSRSLLLRYFKHIHRSTKRSGLFVLDVMGGWETQKVVTDRHEIEWRKRPGRKKKETFTYIWKQENFNPINHNSTFSIGFQFKDGSRLKRVFTYDWRVWTLPELQDLLREAGFRNVHVFWEGEDKDGSGNGIFKRKLVEENCEVFINYLVAEK